MSDRLSPEMLLSGYAQGIFPMAEARDDARLYWFAPDPRGIMPLDGFHASRSLQKTLRRGVFTYSINRAFDAVIAGCAARPETWINAPLTALYRQLHQAGFAHSLEVWADGQLVGGVFGVTLGGAFFGESMFSRATDASKCALAMAVAHLNAQGFSLFDTQYLTPHLASLGGIEISRDAYQARLATALTEDAAFDAPLPDPQSVLQWIAQTS